MGVSLKKVKKELQSDLAKVGKDAQGDYKYTPPNIVGRRVNNYPKLRVTKLKKMPDESKGIMKTTALVSSENSVGTRYKVTIHFEDVEFREIESSQFKNSIGVGRGKNARELFFRNITYGKNPVKLRCQCKDFRHRFQKPLRDEGGLFGGFIGYTRKTDPWPVGRPFANSTEKLGVCKHITSVLKELQKDGMLKNR